VQTWLAQRWRKQLEATLDSSVLEREGWIEHGKIRASVRRAIDREWVPNQLWYLVVLESWLRQESSKPVAQHA
jgi:hypothetical protein